jgi:hypothetical protein
MNEVGGVKKNVFSIQKRIEKFDLLALMVVEKLIFHMQKCLHPLPFKKKLE